MPHQGSELSPAARLLNLAAGTMVTQAIAVAAHLKVADVLKDGPRSADDVAKVTGAHGRSVYRLLRALASVGVLTEQSGEVFALTPIGDCLRTDAPASLAGTVKFFGEGWHTTAWGDLLHSVKTGACAFEHIYGEKIFEWLPKHPREAESFYEGMTSVSRVDAEAVARAYDFTGLKKIADIGGGHGLLLAAILKANPSLCGVLYDLPSVLEGAKSTVAEAGLRSRCEVIGGDFFHSVPADCDVYILKYILHDWDDDTCVQILKHCASSMSRGGRVLVIEQVLPPIGEPSLAKLIDLEMLAMSSGGSERTESEYTKLFAKAGLTLVRTVRMDSPASILEAVSARRCEARSPR